MSNTYYRKLPALSSKILYGIETSHEQGINAFGILILLFLNSILNAYCLVSILFLAIRYNPNDFIYYLALLITSTTIFGFYLNLVSIFEKRIRSLKSIFQLQNFGILLLCNFFFTISSFSLALNFFYKNRLTNIEDISIILRNRSLIEVYFFVFIYFLQILLIGIIVIQKKLVLDSITNNVNEIKAKEYDYAIDYYKKIFNDSITYKLNEKNLNEYFQENANNLVKNKNHERVKEKTDNLFLEKFLNVRKTDHEKERELQVQIFSGISHELGNSVPFIHVDLIQLVNYIGNKYPLLLNEKLKETSNSENVQDLIARMNYQLDYSTKILTGMSRIIKCNPSKIQREQISFNEFINKIFANKIFNNGKVSLKIENQNCNELYVDKIQFTLFLESILENANRHGFKYDQDYCIFIKIGIDNSDIILEIYNDGEPFDEDFTKLHYITPSKHLGETGNTGLGGYLVNLVINNHGGELIDIGNSQNEYENYKVFLKIKLPLTLNLNVYE